MRMRSRCSHAKTTATHYGRGCLVARKGVVLGRNFIPTFKNTFYARELHLRMGTRVRSITHVRRIISATWAGVAVVSLCPYAHRHLLVAVPSAASADMRAPSGWK